MRQSLQSKFNLLGLLLVAFFLLMLPMFTQVKQDTRDSLKEARNTSLYKFSRELAKDFQPPKDLDETKVEDYWDEYQKEAREADPDCPACNPDGDADGDNMTNKEEVEQGRNPLCNEEEKGFEHCQNVDDKIDDPLPPPGVPVLLHTITFTPQNCTNDQLPVGGNCGGPWSFAVPQNFSLLVAYLNMTEFEGGSWDVTMSSDGPESWSYDQPWSDGAGTFTPPGSPPPAATFTGRATLEPTEPADQSASFQYTSGGPTTGRSGNWTIMVYGIR